MSGGKETKCERNEEKELLSRRDFVQKATKMTGAFAAGVLCLKEFGSIAFALDRREVLRRRIRQERPDLPPRSGHALVPNQKSVISGNTPLADCIGGPNLKQAVEHQHWLSV